MCSAKKPQAAITAAASSCSAALPPRSATSARAPSVPQIRCAKIQTFIATAVGSQKYVSRNSGPGKGDSGC